MELTQDDVTWILKVLETSDVDYLELELAGMRIVVSRSGRFPNRDVNTPAVAALPAPLAMSNGASVPQEPTIVPPGRRSSGEDIDANESSTGLIDMMEDLIPVTAPVVGVFYVAPEPGAPPFVEVGMQVEAGRTLGLIEVMKMFSSVAAAVDGVIVQRLVDDAEFVEFGQPLFKIRATVATTLQ